MSVPPVRVMIVEDSAVIRLLLTRMIEADPRLRLTAAFSNAEDAIIALPRVKPDVVSMDIRLPGMDGLEAIARIMTDHPLPIVVFADAVEDTSLKISMNALRAGALTVVEKPRGLGTVEGDALAESICTQLFIMSQVPVIRRRSFATPRPAVAAPPQAALGAGKPAVLAIAASTGGPPALAKVLGDLPTPFPLPILLVQHMGAPFMEGFASWLDGILKLDVRLAVADEHMQPGVVHVAPGDRHLAVKAGGVLRLLDDAPQRGQRPAANVLFSSLARLPNLSAVGILLTGMGEDGADGLLAMRRAGNYTITEDESTAIVYGMPGAARRIGASCASVPLEAIGPTLMRLLKGQPL
jgi:two-component system chemotaxis response regulator CheB